MAKAAMATDQAGIGLCWIQPKHVGWRVTVDFILFELEREDGFARASWP